MSEDTCRAGNGASGDRKGEEQTQTMQEVHGEGIKLKYMALLNLFPPTPQSIGKHYFRFQEGQFCAWYLK